MFLEEQLKEKLSKRARDFYFDKENEVLLDPSHFIKFFEELELFPDGINLYFQEDENFICTSSDQVLSRVPWEKGQVNINDFVQLGFLLIIETWDRVLAAQNRSEIDPLDRLISARNEVLKKLIEKL